MAFLLQLTFSCTKPVSRSSVQHLIALFQNDVNSGRCESIYDSPAGPKHLPRDEWLTACTALHERLGKWRSFHVDLERRWRPHGTYEVVSAKASSRFDGGLYILYTSWEIKSEGPRLTYIEFATAAQEIVWEFPSRTRPIPDDTRLPNRSSLARDLPSAGGFDRSQRP